MRVRLALAVTAALLFVPATTAGAVDLKATHRNTVAVCDGPVLWHFVHNQVSADNATAGELTASFSSAGTVVVGASKVLQQVRHYDVTTESGDTLLNASDTIAEGKLVLSHTECLPGTPPPDDECVAGDVVTVTWAVELGDPTRWGLYETSSQPASLLPGTYAVTLTSTDVNHRAGFQTNQDQEQWYVALTLGGSHVTSSGTIADLPTELTTLTQSVGSVTLPDGADTAIATHALAFTDPTTWGSPESVEPTTAVFTCL